MVKSWPNSRPMRTFLLMRSSALEYHCHHRVKQELSGSSPLDDWKGNCISTICNHPPGFSRYLSSRTYDDQRFALMPSARYLLLIKSKLSGLRRSSLLSSRKEAFRFHLFLTYSWTGSTSLPFPLLAPPSSSSSLSLWPKKMSTPVI